MVVRIVMWFLFYSTVVFAQDIPEATRADNPAFRYSGRIDFANPEHPKIYYPGSQILVKFEGTSVQAVFSDENFWNGGNYLGVYIDDQDEKIVSLVNGRSRQVVELATGLADTVHTLLIVRRNDVVTGALTFHGLILDEDKSVHSANWNPSLKLEIFGDSVTAGSSNECAEDNRDCGTPHSNGYLTAGNILARKLNADIHNNGIGGLAVMDNTGWYESKTIGLQTTYDKLAPFKGRFTNWDFNRYRPDIVIMAFGINDEFTNGLDDPELWKTLYIEIVQDLYEKYDRHPVFLFGVPKLGVVKSIALTDDVVDSLNADGIPAFHVKYSMANVDGHLIVSENELMAQELYDCIMENDLLSLVGVDSKTGHHMPNSFQVQPNYPNPFNPKTTLTLELEKPLPVRIRIYNPLGQCVKTLTDSELSQGQHQFQWDGRDDKAQRVVSGMYLAHFQVGAEHVQQKLLFLK